jgi:transcriptional regulator with XRE-family HTH domain
VTFARRLAAAGISSIVLAAATASLATARDDGSPPPADCGVLVILTLPCEPSQQPAPVIDLPVEPVVTELVPSLTEPIEEVAPSGTELLPAATDGLLQPVLPIGQAPAADVPAANGADPQPAVEPPAVGTDGAHAMPEAGTQALNDRSAAGARTIVVAAPTTGSRRQLGPARADGSAVSLAGDLADTPPPFVPAVALTLALGGGAALAIELARGGGSWAGVVAFNVWLRRQLREARMSQRQLAMFSGVDHSTISRLMSGEREPSLATATRIAEAFRKLEGMPHAGDYFARLAEAPMNPTKRVEAALLGDEELDDADVRELMHAYLAARARRRRARAAAGNGRTSATGGRTPA